MSSAATALARVAIILGIVGLLISCSSGASADEQAVCSSVQRTFDLQIAGRKVDGLNSLPLIRAAAEKTDNKAFRRGSDRMFTSLEAGGKVDAGSLTLAESQEMGERLLRESAGGLQELIDECQRLGATVERVPRPPG